MASLKTSRDGVGVAILSDKIYAVGGFDRAYLNSVECFDPRVGLGSVFFFVVGICFVAVL